MKKKGMGSHQSSNMLTDEWLTPPEIIDLLGPFDLDPCSPIDRPWDTAKQHYTIKDDGLIMPWFGFVWVNPPYGNKTGLWLHKLKEHNNGIALIFARTETEVFFENVWKRASSVLFIKGRLFFYRYNGESSKTNSGAPSVLVGYGDEADKRLRESKIKGKYIKL